MKKLTITLLAVLSSMAYAGDGTSVAPSLSTGNVAQQQQQQLSESSASNSGVSQEIVFTSPENSTSRQEVHYSGSQKVKNVPSVSPTPLTSSNDTCMGSSSGSINVAGFGAGYGSTWTDKNCVMLKNSREMWNMGMRAASLTLMCNDKDNREALELTGYECAQTTRDKQNGKKTNVESAEITDPFVRNRLGLVPLK